MKHIFLCGKDPGSGIDLPLDDVYFIFELLVGLYHGRNFVYAVDDRGVILFSQNFGDIHIRNIVDHVVAKIHDDLPWEHKLGISPLGGDIVRVDSKVLRHHAYDRGGGDLGLLG